MDIYKRYDFSYNEKTFMKNLKNILVEKGYSTLSLFHKLLESIGVTSYETARSYYNMRRVIPFDILSRLCEKIDLNITKIMFPNSILEPEYKEYIANDHKVYLTTYNLFMNIFPLFKTDYMDDEKIEIEFNYDVEKCIYKLSLVLSKYNYLLQKYNYSSLCNLELMDLTSFSFYFIKDRLSGEGFKWEEFIQWRKGLNSIDFLKSFYEKYTLAFQGYECYKILAMNKSYLSDELFNKMKSLLPEEDRTKI